MAQTILRRRAVEATTGDPRSTMYLKMAQGLFPRQVNLGPRSVGWPANEIAALNAARIAGKSEEEIRELVASLHAKRASRQVEF